MDSTVHMSSTAHGAALRCPALGLEANPDAILFSEFTDALADLHERPEVMRFLVAHTAVIGVVTDMLQVAVYPPNKVRGFALAVFLSTRQRHHLPHCLYHPAESLFIATE
jgi:hypothetical protein